jgi:hypothetical protein
VSDVDIKRADAEGFAKAVSTCLVTLDQLPSEWQRRAVAMISAAYKPEPKNELAGFQQQLGQLSGGVRYGAL